MLQAEHDVLDDGTRVLERTRSILFEGLQARQQAALAKFLGKRLIQRPIGWRLILQEYWRLPPHVSSVRCPVARKHEPVGAAQQEL